MNSTILWTKNENGTLDRVLGLNDSTILTTNKNLSQLSDVDGTAAPSDQQVLIYNGATAKWVPSLPRFANLGDVSFSNLAGSNVIKWIGGTTSRWVNRDMGYAILTITGKIADLRMNDTAGFNILNSANYDLNTDTTPTFNIQAFSNNNIEIVSTDLENSSIRGLVNGLNYRIEWNFNYTLLTPPGGTVNTQFDFRIFSAAAQINNTGYRLGPNSLNITNSLTLSNSASTSLRFFIQKNSALPTIVGLPDLNVNITISVIEM